MRRQRLRRTVSPAGVGLAMVALLALALPPVGAEDQGSDALARGDAAWAQRSEGGSNGQALPGPIAAAVAAYSEALAADPRSLEARWKLMRALYFQGDYVATERDARLPLFDRGKELGEEGLEQIAERVGGSRELKRLSVEEVGATFAGERQVAELYHWCAVQWGLWGRERGKVAAARMGVAKKIRDYATISALIDETVQHGGGRRILGRLHYEAPKIPLVTGWVDRQTALAELRRAVELAPDDMLSRLYLAEAILDHDRDRRAEAIELLEGIVADVPEGEFRVEEERSHAAARELLERLG